MWHDGLDLSNDTVDGAASAAVFFIDNGGLFSMCEDDAVDGAAAPTVLLVGGVGVGGSDEVCDGESVHYRDGRVCEEERAKKCW